jgi:hypothetical protein
MATTARSALSLFLRLGGHVELPEDKVFIDPLPGYVENKAAFAESRFPFAFTFDNALACACPQRKVPGWKQAMADAIRSKGVVRSDGPVLTPLSWSRRKYLAGTRLFIYKTSVSFG